MSEKVIITSKDFDNPEAVAKFQKKLREKINETKAHSYIKRILTAGDPDEVFNILDEAIEDVGMFRKLDPKEEAEFREWGQKNDPTPDQIQSWSVIHPVIREEWRKRGFKP